MIAKVSIFFLSAKCLDKKIEGRSQWVSPQLLCFRIVNPYTRHGWIANPAERPNDGIYFTISFFPFWNKSRKRTLVVKRLRSEEFI